MPKYENTDEETNFSGDDIIEACAVRGFNQMNECLVIKAKWEDQSPLVREAWREVAYAIQRMTIVSLQANPHRGIKL